MADILNKLNSANYVTVKVTDNPITNGTNLLVTYENAKTKTPNGIALSSSNRLAIILPPGIYDLGTESLILDAQYIDIIGSTNNKDDHFVKSNNVTGVITQTNNDIKLYNLKIQNIGAGCDYYPNTNLNLTYIENIFFAGSSPTRNGINYSGKYINCSGGDNFFGGTSVILSGFFSNCIGENYSFGYILNPISPGTFNSLLSGTFRNCKAGNNSFTAHNITGNFQYCTAGNNSFFGIFISAILRYCTAGNNSFIGPLEDTDFEYCAAGDYSFGYAAATGTAYNITSSRFKYCKGGLYCFGGVLGFSAATINGQFINCFSSSNGFGNDGPNVSINENSVFINCTACGPSPYSIKKGTYINCYA